MREDLENQDAGRREGMKRTRRGRKRIGMGWGSEGNREGSAMRGEERRPKIVKVSTSSCR